MNQLTYINVLGYCCLFLMSCYIGKFYQNLKINKKRSLIGLLSVTCIMWALFFLLVTEINLTPSRPLANITYILWGLANGTLHLLIISIYDCIYPENFRYLIFSEMISNNRLLIFILSNLISSVIVKNLAQTGSVSIVYVLKINYLYLTITCFIIYAYHFLYFIPKIQKNNYIILK